MSGHGFNKLDDKSGYGANEVRRELLSRGYGEQAISRYIQSWKSDDKQTVTPQELWDFIGGGSSGSSYAGSSYGDSSFFGSEGGASVIAGEEPALSLAEQFEQLAGLNLQYLPQFNELLAREAGKYLPQYLSLYDQLREADLGNILRTAEGYQPRLDALQRATEGADLSEMRDLGARQVLEELRAGQELSPEMRRQSEQNLRASEVARGFGAGGGSANREAVAKSLAGYNLWKDRLGLSQQVRNFEQGMRYDPLQFTATTPTNMPYAQGAFDQGAVMTNQALGGAMQMKSLQDQLAQSGSQFSRNLAFQHSQSAMDRALQQQAIDIKRRQYEREYGSLY